ncbi:sigma-54-dependent transcriptional regulator [Planctomyces sp. SH-PL14]|uniref:sigma-54-dependent transcriptional regulator n=1 Tax=Planctomyces sp. SH-PL14 TaxID=1632864 RepID=UPI00078BEAF6|nr:sigma-54 dependent transcriptional regulator [Planctomyces sp. SH-PL14]AMV16983.1 Transcriptional regulatory protein QseF [Planctomyces sp. SH-PL14]
MNASASTPSLLTPSPRILVADDEPLYRRTTAALLEKEGFRCVQAADGHAALRALESEPFDLVLSDLNMPGNLRLELLHEGRRRWPEVPLIVVTGAATLPSAIEAVRLGIADYLLKPVRFEELLTSVRKVLAQATRRRETVEEREPGTFADLIGDSPPMRELQDMLRQVARTDTNILITGESGTGKEVVARTIHRHSLRADQPFQVIDCTAIPEALFESLLFGHVRGAFTGAVRDQTGLLLQAHRGTVFFDEIGDLPAPLQSKLLRVIQEQTFLPLGKNEPERIDVRFLCATNRDLELDVRAGRFRRDLFYRLAVIPIVLPPLRDRDGDVVLLARHFLRLLSPADRPGLDLGEAAVERLAQYGWPGNIRELRNAIEHGIAMARTDRIEPQDLPAAIRSGGSDPAAAPGPLAVNDSRAGAMEDAERRYLVQLLKDHAGNVARSAVQAGLSRQGLHKLLRKHSIDAAEFRP